MDTKKKISKELKAMNEALKPEDLEVRIGDLVNTTKDTLNVDEPEAKEFVAGMVGEGDGAVSRGIEHGMNPEVQADEYEEYRQLMQQLAAEEGDNANEGMKLNQPTPRTGTARSADSPLKLNQPTPRTGTARSADSPLKLNQKVIHTEAEGETNNPVKLKNDVKRVLAKLDMSSIKPYLAKIDNPTEQAEMIGQFAEMIGVPRNKLSSVIAQLKILSKGDSNVRENTKSNKNVIRTVKVKDIK